MEGGGAEGRLGTRQVLTKELVCSYYLFRFGKRVVVVVRLHFNLMPHLKGS